MPRRTDQLAQEIRDDVGKFLKSEIEFPADTFVTVTRVEVSKNRRAAKVYLSSLPETSGLRALKTVRQRLYALQGAVNESLGRRHAPRLTLALDRMPRELERLDRLVRQ